LPNTAQVPPGRLGAEVDLQNLAGGAAAHHHVEERLPVRNLEPVRVMQEGHIDAAGVVGVGVHHLVATARRAGGELLDQQVEDESVLDLADPEQVRAGAVVHLHDHRGQLGDLPIPQLRGPARDVLADHAFHLVLAPLRRRVLLIDRFSTFHQAR
jgi:hypothetical protein